jgi:PPK2 family polyphosphate:nucleotide phosphotransferase
MSNFNHAEWSKSALLAPGADLPTDTKRLAHAPQVSKKVARKIKQDGRQSLASLQEALYAEGTRALLIVLQGLDTAGKDGTIKALFRGVNPQGVRVASFKVPTAQEAAHDFLWRIHLQVPEKGMIGIFNRSHYEDLVVPLATGHMGDDEYRKRCNSVANFEQELVNEGVQIVKLYLHVSYKVQGQRLLARLDRPEKHWKFSQQDLATRARWDKFFSAYNRVIPDTSFEYAPWYVIPADDKWYRNTVAMEVVLAKLMGMAPHVPFVDIANIDRLKKELIDEMTKGS